MTRGHHLKGHHLACVTIVPWARVEERGISPFFYIRGLLSRLRLARPRDNGDTARPLLAERRLPPATKYAPAIVEG
jgi:hypothetical protein